MAKRKCQEEILQDLKSYGLDMLASQLQAEGGQAWVAQASLTVDYLGSLMIPDLQAFSDMVPTFSKAWWEKIAPQFGLEVDKDMTQLKLFTVSHTFLLPSFHWEVMKNSVWWLNIYQETGSHSREAARVRLMDVVSTWSFMVRDILTIFTSQWHVPICALFKGHVVDRAEHPMPETLETSGVWVEHKVYMIEGIILIVIELKLCFKDLGDHTVQLLLELACEYHHHLIPVWHWFLFLATYKVNTDKKNWQTTSCLCNVDWSAWLLYPSLQWLPYSLFIRTKSLSLHKCPCYVFLHGMINGSLTVTSVIKDCCWLSYVVTEILFSVILESYIQTLEVISMRLKSWGLDGDVSAVVML